MTKFFYQWFNDINETYSLIIEDNGIVAYAYLLEGNNIISDVWLYNQADTPPKMNWGDATKMPFMNPLDFLNEKMVILPLTDSQEVNCEFEFSTNTSELICVDIYIRRIFIAKLKPNFKPGWSTRVIKDGPLAKLLK